MVAYSETRINGKHKENRNRFTQMFKGGECWGILEIHPHVEFVRTEGVQIRISTGLLGPE